jgi:hypothetical protein
MNSRGIPGRPDPDQVYRRFSARDWWNFFSDLTSGSVQHQCETAQDCPFCHAARSLWIRLATTVAPPAFACFNCGRKGDILDFVAEYEQFRLEPLTDAVDWLAQWAGEKELPEVAQKAALEQPNAPAKVVQLRPETGDRRFELLRIKDFLDVPPTPALIANVLPSAQVSVLFGQSNSFKSFLAIDMLCSIATGRSWHSFPVEQGAVLYIVTEGAHEAVAKRIVGWFEDKALPIEAGNAAIGIIKVPVIMNRTGDVDALIATIREGLPGCKLAVFDLLAGSMEGSEADSEIVTAWVRGTQRLADELTCTQLHVTHSGYSDASRGRGHSHLWGSFSTRLKAEGDALARTTFLSVERHKDWDAAGLGWSFDLVQIPVGAGHETTLVPKMRQGPTNSAVRAHQPGRKIPKGLRYLRQSLDVVMDAASDITPFPDGPIVKAVPLETVRGEFNRRYPGGTGDDLQKANTRRKAWDAVLLLAVDATNGEVGYRQIGKQEWIWPI